MGVLTSKMHFHYIQTCCVQEVSQLLQFMSYSTRGCCSNTGSSAPSAEPTNLSSGIMYVSQKVIILYLSTFDQLCMVLKQGHTGLSLSYSSTHSLPTLLYLHMYSSVVGHSMSVHWREALNEGSILMMYVRIYIYVPMYVSTMIRNVVN